MEFDPNLMHKIARLDDDTLARGVQNVCQTLGIDAATAAPYLGDMSKIKAVLAGMTEENLQKIRAALGDDRLNRIVGAIQSEVKED